MFKKREKKEKINLAKDDLNGAEPKKKYQDDIDDDLEIQKKNNKKFGIKKQTQDNKDAEGVIKDATSHQMDNVHFRASDKMHGNSVDHATIDLAADQPLDKRTLMLQKIREQAQNGETGELQNDYNQDGKTYYKGKQDKNQYIKLTEDQIRNSKWTGQLGPLNQATNVRTTCNFDFNPEICKDFKEKGYCSFGDTCLYIHDRSDYKGGAQLEMEYKQKQKDRMKNEGRQVESSDDEDEQYAQQIEEIYVPKYCSICDERFREPIVTICGHFFCENCAIKQYSKSKLCHSCGAKTNGMFNDAIKKLAKLKVEKKALIKQRNQYRKTVNKDLVEDDEVTDTEEEEENNEEQEEENEQEGEEENNNNNIDYKKQKEDENMTYKRKREEVQDQEYQQMEAQLKNADKELKTQKERNSFKVAQDWNY